MPLLVLERASCDLEVFVQGSSRASNSLLLGLCRDIGNSLAALHAEWFTHGDLKPKNVLIFETLTGWIAKFCDFGCALRKVENDDAPNDSSPKEPHPRPRYLGTVGWKPPEAASPGTLDLNHEDWKHLRQPMGSLGFAIRLARGILDPKALENLRILAGPKRWQLYFRRMNDSRVHRPLRPIEKREIDKHLVSKASAELVISEATNSGDEGPSTRTLRRRTTSSVEGTTDIWTAMSGCFKGPVKPTRLYYWARKRPDVPLALWNNVEHDRRPNFLEVALKSEPAVDTVTLAWLYRGEVGASEVEISSRALKPGERYSVLRS